MSECCENPYVKYQKYNLGEVRLYGRLAATLEPEDAGKNEDILSISLTKGKGGYGLSISDASAFSAIRSIGIIYGYAFEGHCYKLPKPMVMVIPGKAYDVVDGDCGYNKNLGYSVWAIDKLARVVILDVRTDTVKALVLDENTPGNRSPLAYSQAQALAPQRSRD